MTNRKLVTQWENLSIKFKSDNLIRPMKDMFLICLGERECNIDGKGKKGKTEKLVIFDEGGKCDEGAPIFFCKSDKQDNCWIYAWDGQKKIFIKSNIGKFVKNE